MKEKVKFAFHVLTHPFDGFWDLKREGKGSLLLAFIFIFLWILSNVSTQEVTSFLFNETALQLVDISVEIQKVLTCGLPEASQEDVFYNNVKTLFGNM